MGLMGLMGAHAQFDDYGVKLGLGSATLADDLSTSHPILGVNVGGYINYSFKHSPTALAEIFYLQTGLNLTRRGNSFQEVFENGNTLIYREGHHHAWYVQLPVLAGVHFELPVREPGHVVGFYLGPTVSYGLFGHYADRVISPGVTAREANYDVQFSGSDADRKLFNHISRLDVSAVLGVSYERGDFTFSLFIDHGFLSVADDVDVLRIILDNISGGNSSNTDYTIPGGNNNTVMLSVAYKLGSFMK